NTCLPAVLLRTRSQRSRTASHSGGRFDRDREQCTEVGRKPLIEAVLAGYATHRGYSERNQSSRCAGRALAAARPWSSVVLPARPLATARPPVAAGSGTDG